MKKRYYKRYYHKFQSRTIANSIDFQTKEISMLFVMAYSTDLKLRVTSYVEEGHTLVQTAALRFILCLSFIGEKNTKQQETSKIKSADR